MGSKQPIFLASIDAFQGNPSIEYIEYLVSISAHLTVLSSLLHSVRYITLRLFCLLFPACFVTPDIFQVTKELKNLNKKIVECTWDDEKNQWKFLRVREDKSFPNGYETAMSKFTLSFYCCRDISVKMYLSLTHFFQTVISY